MKSIEANMEELKYIVKLEDFNNRSLEDIIELYRSGYILEDTQFQPSIQQLQLPSYSSSIVVFLVGTLAGLALMLLLRGKLEQK